MHKICTSINPGITHEQNPRFQPAPVRVRIDPSALIGVDSNLRDLLAAETSALTTSATLLKDFSAATDIAKILGTDSAVAAVTAPPLAADFTQAMQVSKNPRRPSRERLRFRASD